MPVVFVRDRVEDRHQKLHHRKSWTGTGNEREIFPPLFSRISRAFFSPGFCRFFSGTSLDSMYEQWNCESNMYWITIVLLPAIAMLSHFLNPWLITALTGTPVSINNEVFQTEEIYIIVCCLIKDLSLLFYYFKYYTIHMGFNTLF